MITDLYCDGIEVPIPWAGTAYEFEREREQAHRASGSRGMEALVLRWTLNGRAVVLDLNRTRIVAMVERDTVSGTVPPPTGEEPDSYGTG